MRNVWMIGLVFGLAIGCSADRPAENEGADATASSSSSGGADAAASSSGGSSGAADAGTTARGSADAGGSSSGASSGSSSGVTTGGPDAGGGANDVASSGKKFSFFVTSLAALQKLSGSEKGFGGDFRFGEKGPGAGLRGADKICATIAETSMPGVSKTKVWRAFLSVTAGEDGKPVHAIDRIGDGPWYDRLGRVVAKTKSDLLNVRPKNADPAIANDLPNEHGVPNHQPDPTEGPVDNHHMLTGSGEDGKLKSATSTCKDWTTADGAAANGKPECGFAWPRAKKGGPGGKPGGPPGGGKGGQHWMTTYAAPGCAAGVDIHGKGGPKPGADYVGGGGGYGGFYCFATTP